MNFHHSTRHAVDLFLLILILSLGLGGMLIFANHKIAQIVSVLLMSALYVFWGVYHHHHDRNLTGKVVLEYTGIALLVATILILFLLRV